LDNAQRAYDAAVQRFNQISVESSSTQIDISLLNPATPAVKPSGPSPVLIAVIAMIVGAFLGFLFAIIAELLDRRIRTSSDLQLILDDVPTLGVIEWQVRTDRMRASKSFFRLMRSN
jgi:capsular polysaccharide biosynthesis protein